MALLSLVIWLFDWPLLLCFLRKMNWFSCRGFTFYNFFRFFFHQRNINPSNSIDVSSQTISGLIFIRIFSLVLEIWLEGKILRTLCIPAPSSGVGRTRQRCPAPEKVVKKTLWKSLRILRSCCIVPGCSVTLAPPPVKANRAVQIQ